MDVGLRRLVRGIDRIVAHVFVLDEEPHHVDAKPVDAALQPELQDIEHGLPNRGIAPVEIGLLAQEAVQIILSGGRIERPGRPTKLRYPVVGWPAVGPGIAPDIPVALAAEAGGAALLKPRMSVRCVVGYEVENDFQMAVVRRLY